MGIFISPSTGFRMIIMCPDRHKRMIRAIRYGLTKGITDFKEVIS